MRIYDIQLYFVLSLSLQLQQAYNKLRLSITCYSPVKTCYSSDATGYRPAVTGYSPGVPSYSLDVTGYRPAVSL